MKTLKRFFISGILYYIIEIIWRAAVNHRPAHPIMIAVAGTVVAVIFYLDDKKLNIFLNSFIGALVATLCELIIGTISLDVFGERLWNYGILSYRGIISLIWSLLWVLLCFAGIFAKRIFEKIQSKKHKE